MNLILCSFFLVFLGIFISQFIVFNIVDVSGYEYDNSFFWLTLEEMISQNFPYLIFLVVMKKIEVITLIPV